MRGAAGGRGAHQDCDGRRSERTPGPPRHHAIRALHASDPLTGLSRDGPREFPHPDEIDVDRAVNRHLVFGAGPHRCLGSNLARRQILVAIQEILARLDDIRLKPEQEFTYHSGFSRGLVRLDITHRARTDRS